MRLKQFITGAAVALSTFGLLLPPEAIAHAADAVSGVRQAAVTIDLALGQGGTIRGQVVNQDAIGKADTIVSIRQGDREVARTVTDDSGAFAVTGLKSGVYVVASGKSATLVRAWNSHAAPPSAAEGILLVPNELTVRGQERVHDLLHGNGGHLGLGKHGIGALLVVGVIGTITALSLDDDAS